jgi:CheY-like chemotaxis protein
MPSILVLDDEPLISMLLEDWLAELGCETIGPVQSVQSALDAIARTAPDAAILDVSLRSENSYSVADVLRGRGVRFAFATGHGANALAPRFKDAPVLAKPYDLPAVKDIIAKLLDQAAPAEPSMHPA